jgi:hypothetical protein
VVFNPNDCAEDTTLRNLDGSWAFRNTRSHARCAQPILQEGAKHEEVAARGRRHNERSRNAPLVSGSKIGDATTSVPLKVE